MAWTSDEGVTLMKYTELLLPNGSALMAKFLAAWILGDASNPECSTPGLSTSSYVQNTLFSPTPPQISFDTGTNLKNTSPKSHLNIALVRLP